MANLMKSLGKYIGKYLNTRVVFALDMFMSLASSLITLVLATFFSSADLFAVKPAVVWMGTSLLSSFFLLLSQALQLLIRKRKNQNRNNLEIR